MLLNFVQLHALTVTTTSSNCNFKKLQLRVQLHAYTPTYQICLPRHPHLNGAGIDFFCYPVGRELVNGAASEADIQIVAKYSIVETLSFRLQDFLL